VRVPALLRARGDDTRRFPCKAKKCSGHHLVHQPNDADEASLLSCSSCGVTASAAYAASLLAGESALAAELRNINSIIDSGRHVDVDVVPLIRRLKAPHPHHHLAAKVAHVQWEMSTNQQEWRAAVEAAKARVECRNAIVRIPSRDTAFCYEYLGNALVAQADASAAGQAAALLGEAQDAYQHAVRAHLPTTTATAICCLTAATVCD
jgi:hypothetical protein